VSENVTIIKRLETITVPNMNSAVSLDPTLCSVLDMHLPKVCDPATELRDVTFLKNTVFSRIIISILSVS